MGQAQPFHSEESKSTDHLSGLRRLLLDLESGRTAIICDGADVTRTYVMVLTAQIQHIETLLAE